VVEGEAIPASPNAGVVVDRCALGFGVIGEVMLVTGLTSRLPLRYYHLAPAYHFLILVVLFYSSR
jgi:hypothetical protein